VKLSDDVQVVVTIGYIAALEREARSEGQHSVWSAGLARHERHSKEAWANCNDESCRIIRDFVAVAVEEASDA